MERWHAKNETKGMSLYRENNDHYQKSENKSGDRRTVAQIQQIPQVPQQSS